MPNESGKLLLGGQLFMLKVRGTDLANLGASYANDTRFDVEWVAIASPDNSSSGMPGNFASWATSRGQNGRAPVTARTDAGCS